MADLLAPYRPHAAGEDALRQARRCHYPDGTPALRAVAAALLCSGWIHRLIRDPKTGQPLDHGRAQRQFTPRQRRALIVRDGGSAFPGCDRKPKWCDAHHLRPWEDDGLTDLANGCLLCRRHHNLIHHNGWTLERDVGTGSSPRSHPTDVGSPDQPTDVDPDRLRHRRQLPPRLALTRRGPWRTAAIPAPATPSCVASRPCARAGC